MNKRKKIIIIAAAALIVAVVLVNLASSQGAAAAVTVEKVAPRDLVEKVSASGEIKPKKNINISTDVAGKVLKITVKEGDLVKKGELLIKIDSAIYESYAQRDREIISSAEADLISQDASLKKAKQYFERRQQLYAEGLIPLEQFEDARSSLEMADASRKATQHRLAQAQASLKSTTDSLQKTNIVSPIDGIVTSLKVEEGEVAIIGTMNNPGTVLMTIADLSIMEAEVLVDETDVVKVKPGKKAEVAVDAIPGQTMNGAVTEVGNSAIATAATTSTSSGESKDFKTVITLDNPPVTLKPGFSATADIIIDEKKNVLAVPIAALVIQEKPEKGREAKKEETEGVMVLENGACRFQSITKGITGDMYVEIRSGLKKDETIITGPFAVLKKLKAGDRVKVAPSR